jgi:NAD(P)-dependent dehydrogenase (short-subunit alcohol dehydrogenase family)
MPTVFITGANRGIGLEFTRQYAADGWTVIATCRNPIQPGELAMIPGTIEVHGLDVTDHRQVDRLAGELKGRAFDILINNAGVYGPRGMTSENMDYAEWESVLRTNALAPFKVATAFTDNVAAGKEKKLVTISSVMGSIERSGGGGEYIYRSSKAAVNMAMRSLSGDLAPRGLIVAMFHPGWVQTDMGGPSAAIDAVTSVSGLRKAIAGLTKKDNGGFFNYDGTPIEW